MRGLRWSLCVLAVVTNTRGTQDAIANGETRTISILHMHTKEEITVTFKSGGYYNASALEKLNWALRDWRRDEPIKMDPRLFDVLWEVHREVGSDGPFRVVSAYRSPQTNAMLRRRSRAVAEQSQHMVGKAMDFYLPDASPAKVREIAMRMQRGGVGYYPTAYTPFTHLDVGSVRSWPRMPREQLARIFPDGKTVHIPADGQPLSGYETARAEILSRGGSVAGYGATDYDEGALIASGSGKGFWAALFGGGEEDEARPQRGGNRRGLMAGRRAGPAPTQTAFADNDPLGRFQTAQAPQAEQAVPLKERLSARGRRRGAPEEAPAQPAAPAAPAIERTQVAALAEAPKPSPAAQAQAAAELARPPANEPAKPSLIDAPIPVARPRNLLDPTQVASTMMPETEGAAGKIILAPAPPARPIALSTPVAGSMFSTATVEPKPEGTPTLAPMPPARPVEIASLSAEAAPQAELAEKPAPAGRLVRIDHPAPPERPRLAALAVPPPAPAVARVAAPAASERDALQALFVQAQAPARPASPPRVVTAKARVAAPTPDAIAQEEAPAAALGFAKIEAGDLRTDRFAGPAIRPLPTNFVQQ